MTYNILQKYVIEHEGGGEPLRIRKTDIGALSRAILMVGKDAPDVCTYVSSIMKRRGVPHFTYLATTDLELRERFVGTNGKLISVSKMSDIAGKILRREGDTVNSEPLLFHLSLELVSEEDQFSLVCVGEEFYIRLCDTIASNEIPPFAAAVICTDDTEREMHLRSLAPKGTQTFGCSMIGEITIFRERLLGLEFERGGHNFTIASPEADQARLAALAAEFTRSMIGATRTQTHSGLYSAAPPNAALLYSAVPTIFLKIGERPTSINPNLNLTMITEDDPESDPKDNGNDGKSSDTPERVLFYGNRDYINRIKNDIASGKYSTLL